MKVIHRSETKTKRVVTLSCGYEDDRYGYLIEIEKLPATRRFIIKEGEVSYGKALRYMADLIKEDGPV